MMSLRTFVLHSTLLVALSVPALASAQSSSISDEARATARQLYNQAVQSYDQGKYKDALDRWSEAYDLTQATVLLYSIGNAHERLGNLEEAIEALTGYKQSVRDKEENELLEMRIANLRGRHEAQVEAERLRQEALERERQDAEAREAALRAEQERLAKELLDERLHLLRRDPKGLVVTRWTAIGLAGATAINGVVFHLQANSKEEKIKGECVSSSGGYLCPDGSDADWRAYDRNRRVSQISYGVAGGLALVGGALLFVHPNRNKNLDEVAFEPMFLGDGGGMRFRARW